MSSGSDLRHRSLSISRRTDRLPPHSSSPSGSRRTPPTTPRKLAEFLHKCSSEPLLSGTTSGDGDKLLYRPMTCTDVFSPSPPFLSPEPLRGPHKGYEEDYKVVVTVTVEGSVGPVRTMVKLGSTVDETIKLVMDQYNKESRSPPLDKDSAPQFELHLSCFSLESLNGSDTIGSLGRRTFYLRKGTNFQKPRSITSEITYTTESADPPESCPLLMVFLPAYISRKIAMFLKKIRKLWNMLACLHDP